MLNGVSEHSQETKKKLPSINEVDKAAKDASFSLPIDVFNVNEENVDEIFNKIQEDKDNYVYYIRCAQFLMNIRPKQTEAICSLLSKLYKSAKYVVPHRFPEEQHRVLYKKGIIKNKNPEWTIKFTFFKEGSIEEAIKNDDVEKLIKLSSEPGFNPSGTISITTEHTCSFIMHGFFDISDRFRMFEITYMQLMAFYGSIKCFKYAMIDGSFDDTELCFSAIAGGNKEIINLLVNQDKSFNNCFNVSIKYHRDEISDWLLNNYEIEDIDPSFAIRSYNIRAFYFLLRNNIGLKKNSINQGLFAAAEVGYLPLAKYLIDKCHADVNKRGRNIKMTPTFIACQNNNLEMLKYLVEECNAKTDTLDELRVVKACKDNNYDLVIYLIEKLHIIANLNDGLLIACENGNINIVKLLIEKYHVRYNDIDRNGKSVLHIACQNGNIELIKYLIEQCKVNVEKGTHLANQTALRIAILCENFEVIKYLVEEANANISNKITKTNNKAIKKYIEQQREIRQKKTINRTPLIYIL